MTYETCLKVMYFISKSCPFAVLISFVSWQNKQDCQVLLFKLCQLQFPSQYFCVIRVKSLLHTLSVNYTSRLYLFFSSFFFLLSTSELLYHAMLWEAVVAAADRSLGGGQACDLSGPMFDAFNDECAPFDGVFGCALQNNCQHYIFTCVMEDTSPSDNAGKTWPFHIHSFGIMTLIC